MTADREGDVLASQPATSLEIHSSNQCKLGASMNEAKWNDWGSGNLQGLILVKPLNHGLT